MNDLNQMWLPNVGARLAVLRAELNKPDTYTVELPIPGAPAPCYLGMESGGSIWMRITCDPKSVSTDDQAAAVVFSVMANGYKVAVTPAAAEVVTGHLFEEMIQLLTDGHSPGDVGRFALQHWRDLLARPAGSVLSENALVGLFGELEVLEIVLKNGGEFEYWTGWNHDQLDFRLPALAIEVKSTTSSNYRRVSIHGLGQLADPEDGSDLILVLKRLEPSPMGRSVPSIIESIVKSGVSRSILLDRLSHVGYSDQHRDQYGHSKFVSIDVALRKIDDSHPRLVPSMLSAVDLSSIDKINYELNLNGDDQADMTISLDEVVAQFLEKK